MSALTQAKIALDMRRAKQRETTQRNINTGTEDTEINTADRKMLC